MNKRVYIAGPISKGNTGENIRTAVEAADELADAGFAPFLPQLYFFWDVMHPRSYESWMSIDREFLLACGAVLRLPGDSPGADREVTDAIAHSIPVFYSIEALVIGSLSDKWCTTDDVTKVVR